MVQRTSVGMLVLALLAAVPAGAQDCPPLKLLASIGLTASADTRAELIPVTIEGVPKLVLLDTGGVFSEITEAAADELKLPLQHHGIVLYDESGESSSESTLAKYSLGPLKTDKMYLVIAPGKKTPGKKIFTDDARVAGTLAPDILKHYDVAIDFVKNEMSLLSQDHCPGKVIFWPATTVAVVPMRLFDSGHIVIPAILDGRSIFAFVDTGSPNSTLNLTAAESDYGLKLGSPDTPKSGELKPGSITYRHTFKSLGFEGVAVINPAIDIVPEMTHALMLDNREPGTGSRVADPQSAEAKPTLVIGMDVLRHFHLYIAYRENKLYITPAGQPDTATPAPPPPAAH